MAKRADYRHFTQIATRWNDNDVYGHVNNVQYYSYFDTAINEYLIRSGSLNFMSGPLLGICAESHCKYIAELAFSGPGRRRSACRAPRPEQRALRHRPVPRRKGAGSRRRLVCARLRRPRDSPPNLPHRGAALRTRTDIHHGALLKIRAAVLRESGLSAPYAMSHPLNLETINLAAPNRGEVCVRITAAGLCHSDLSVIDGSRPRPLPMVLGHEAAGSIVERGLESPACTSAIRWSFPSCPPAAIAAHVPQAARRYVNQEQSPTPPESCSEAATGLPITQTRSFTITSESLLSRNIA